MLTDILRILKGETVFAKTVSPRKYRVGSVVMIDVGGLDKALFRVTGVVKDSKSELHSVWGTLLSEASNDTSSRA